MECHLSAALPHRWFAVYTRSRHEKTVLAGLDRGGFDAYLPLHEVLSRWKDRKRWVQKPMFPGYLFVRTPLLELEWVYRMRGVVSVIGNGAGPIPVPDEQVESVRDLLKRPVVAAPWPHLRKGQWVVVKRGPLIGIEGFLVGRKSESRLVISLDLLGRSVAAEVDADSVEPVDARHAARQGRRRGVLV